MKRLLTHALLAGAVVPFLAYAAASQPVVDATPSDAEAEAAYAAAQKAYQNTQVNQPAPGPSKIAGKTVAVVSDTSPEVKVFSDPEHEMVAGTNRPTNTSIESIRVVVDVENDSLRDIMHQVVGQAARYTGPWQVKWRLKPENMALLDERVNLTAEAKFGDFVDLLTDRVKNMSGVQLFVTTYNEARIIMVADTYY